MWTHEGRAKDLARGFQSSTNHRMGKDRSVADKYLGLSSESLPANQQTGPHRIPGYAPVRRGLTQVTVDSC